MKKLFTLLVLAMVSYTCMYSQIVDTNFRDGVLYVKVNDTSSVDMRTYHNSNTALNLMYTQFGIDTIYRPFGGLNDTLDRTYCIHFSQHAQINAMMTAMEALPYVEFCEKEPLITSFSSPFTPNDVNSNQYSLLKIFAPDAWGVSQGSPNIIVAIVDNGVRITHTDLTDNLWTNPTPTNGPFDDYPNDVHGWDVADNNNDPNPPAGSSDDGFFSHGTICAGIAGATTNNNNGIASIGFNISIMAVKCAPDASGDTGKTLTNAYDGVYYATMAGAKVISMSWGGDEAGFVTGQNLINAAYAKGIVLVAAAGNAGVNTPFYPAAFDHVISVGATTALDEKASYSNYGSTLDVMAPGSGIYGLKAGSDNSYGYSSGTSMSTPLVAGLAALILSNNPSLTPDQVTTQIKSTCDNIDVLNAGFVGQMGSGRINAARALGATPTVGIAGIEATELNLNIYPNPSQGHFNIQWKGEKAVDHISIMDISGKVLSEENVEVQPGTFHEINSELSAGIYLLKISSSGQNLMHRIVIQ